MPSSTNMKLARFASNQQLHRISWRSLPPIPGLYPQQATTRPFGSRAFSPRLSSAMSPAQPKSQPVAPSPSNPAMAFPCLDALESRSADLRAGLHSSPSSTPPTSSLSDACSPSATSGPEPSYTTGATLAFHSSSSLLLDWGGILPEFTVAYETWGALDASKSNAILLHTGLSASSHAASTPANSQPGWWEEFIGPDRPLDTNRFFVICTNVLGGCYGSTGPASLDPSDGKPYATRFPILTMEDMVRAQFRLLDHLGIDRLHATVGASMGGMQSLAAGVLFPARVGRVVSISGCARSHPYSIAMRHTQRQVLMMDPNWNRGFYYGDIPPHAGMKLAREIATVTYRSGPEWEARFGRRRADPSKRPALCPDYLIETYLDHAGEKFCLTYDANSLLYVSKAMDLFDLGKENQTATVARRTSRIENKIIDHDGFRGVDHEEKDDEAAACGLSIPDKPYQEQPASPTASQPALQTVSRKGVPSSATTSLPRSPLELPPEDLVAGLTAMDETPTLVMGVASDILFPSWQQREVAEALMLAGNNQVTHIELSEEVSLFGHDTFLLDLTHIGSNLKRFVEAEMG